MVTIYWDGPGDVFDRAGWKDQEDLAEGHSRGALGASAGGALTIARNRQCCPTSARSPGFAKGMHSCSIHLLFAIPFPKMPGNGRAEKCVPLLDFPNREAHIASRGLFDQIAHRAGVDRLFDIRLIVVCRKYEHFGGGDGLENLASGL